MFFLFLMQFQGGEVDQYQDYGDDLEVYDYVWFWLVFQFEMVMDWCYVEDVVFGQFEGSDLDYY